MCEPGLSIADWFEHRVWADGAEVGPFTVTATRVAHPVEAYAIRVTENPPRAAAWSTPATPVPLRRWPSSPAAPTCCWSRRRS